VVTGARGQLGAHLTALLAAGDADVHAIGRDALDITDPAAVDELVGTLRPDVLVNAAAYTAVDAAESDVAAAHAVNATGPGLLAQAVARHGGRMVHVSTDYVFDGTATRPYEPSDPTGPRTAYGRTKLAGEQAVLEALPDRAHVVRTAWVFGGPTKNFVDTMLRLERERETVSVVADQLGSPTWAGDLATALVALGELPEAGPVLHVVNAGQASWCELARETFRLAGADPERVQAIPSSAYPTPAPRPAWSVLSTAAWDAIAPAPMRPWQDALADCLARGA